MKEKITNMNVSQVLHMNGGVGEASYSNNSLVQVYIYILILFFIIGYVSEM